ncbi:MAG TPA: GNAT family protein [Myxococcota bacterium]|nr:GNAT family protein [Myxococcota bacterium]
MSGAPREPRAQPVLLREAGARDLGGFLRCLDVVARERRYLAMVEGPTRAEAEAFLADARARGMVQQVAVAGAEVVGWCDVIRKPFPGFEHSGTLGMGLLPAYRGRGLGARLLAATLEAVEPLGITRVELEVFSTNARAIALYEKSGFTREGVKRAARSLDGRTEDIVCMARVEER